MEILILTCLLIIIALLLQDRLTFHKRSIRKPTPEKVNPELPDIMGQPKPIHRLWVPNNATESQIDEALIDPDNLDIEYDENEEIDIQIPKGELDEVFGTRPDFEEEEETWNWQGAADDDFGFAQGVSFEELAKVGRLLQKDKLDKPQKSEAVEIVQKIQGTELFYLLENSIEGASRKIAQLLDNSLVSDNKSGSSNFRNVDHSDFDIGEFI